MGAPFFGADLLTAIIGKTFTQAQYNLRVEGETMRILSSGLLLGGGGVAIAYGMINRPDAMSINAPIVMGLTLMSLGLFALRVNADAFNNELERSIDSQQSGPIEFELKN